MDSRGQISPLEPAEAAHAVGEVDQADLGPGPVQADGADVKSNAGLLRPKDVLDGGANVGSRGVLHFASNRDRAIADIND